MDCITDYYRKYYSSSINYLYIKQMEDKKMSDNNMDLMDNMIFKLGVEAGRKQVMDHIQHQCRIGKPIEANGELYWLKDSKQHLLDVMDSIDDEWNQEQGLKKFIVPIERNYNGGKVIREIIIHADKAETAMLIAVGDFQHNGWSVDDDYMNYKELK